MNEKQMNCIDYLKKITRWYEANREKSNFYVFSKVDFEHIKTALELIEEQQTRLDFKNIENDEIYKHIPFLY